MKYIEYNNYKISKLSLGTAQFGLDYGIANKVGKPSQSQVNQILNYIQDQGINTFDTAQGYGDSEEVIGNFFKNSQYIAPNIVSKIDPIEFKKKKDYLGTLKISIFKLKVPSLFALLMHNSDLMTQWNNELSNRVKILKDNNLIKYFGVSIYSNKEFKLALNNKDIDVIQIPFNIFDQRALSNNWFEEAKKNNKFLFIRSIYLQGLLLMNLNKIPDKLKCAKKYIKYLDTLTEKLNISRNELCLSFVDTMTQDASILFGCETLEQAKENLNIYKNLKTLKKEILEEINDIFHDIDENIYNPTKW